MTFRNRWLFIAFMLVSIVGLLFQWREHNKMISASGFRNQLSTKIDTLNLVHVQRHCDCPEWIEKSRFKGPGGAMDEDYIYLEAANQNLELGATYPAYTEAGYVLRLQGSFYETKGIPDDVIRHPDQKPESARIFRYISSDLIKPDTIP
jgi:hypothetical protein